MSSLHLSTVRQMLRAPEPVNIKCWKKDGSIMELKQCIPLRYRFYEGTQQFKILASRQIRKVRIALIFEINGIEVFM